jgi:hypothetical protein
MTRRSVNVLIGILGFGIWLALAGQAFAAQKWRVDSLSTSSVQPGDILDYKIQLMNVGDAPMDGSVATVVNVTLPPGLTVMDPAGPISDPSHPHFEPNGLNFRLWQPFSGTPTPCTALDGSPLVGGEQGLRCVSTDALPSIGVITSPWELLLFSVDVDPSASGRLVTHVDVSGGGAPAVSTVDPVTVTRTPPGFGVDAIDGQVVDGAGDPYTQAGGHPYAATVSIDFNTIFKPVPLAGMAWPAEPVKNVLVDLPPGLVGDPSSAGAQCTNAELATTGGSGFTPLSLCPADSQVGTTIVRLNWAPNFLGPLPVFNMVPPPNVPARFGFNVLGSVVVLDGALRSGGDYGLTVRAENVPEAIAIAGTEVTFWGVPSDEVHDPERACPGRVVPSDAGPTCRSGAKRRPFLRNPTSCPDPGVGLVTTARVDSWTNPGVFKEASFVTHDPPGYPLPPDQWGAPSGPTGCARVPFDPTFTANPLLRKTGTPSAFAFDLSIPQNDDATLIGQSDLKRATVTLPMGVRVSPSSADGLGACAPSEIGLNNGGPANCPSSAQVGSVTIDTPLLPDPLTGSVYLARQRDNPFGSLLSVYLVANGPGVTVKLPGRVDADPISGQLTATFDNNPQLPFENLHLEFKGGSRAALVTPKQCGTHTTHAELESWSGRIVAIDHTFSVSHDGNGAPCPGAQFSPDFSGGTKNPTAGRSSPLDLSFSRDDDDEEFKAVTVDMPNGLTGKIADVPLCSESDARSGSCGDASKVGRVTVGAGAGSDPFYISDGRVYLTGPYKGAPFGLSIVVPAVAGPFNLGNVVVRSSIFVDKHTAELRVISDQLPTILEGIPLDVRDVRVSVDRENFILNPTSCAKKRISGSLESVSGSKAAVSTRFQAADCSSLPLRPKMTLTVGGPGHTNRGGSTPLTATLRQTPGQSNLRFVRVTLPTTINARLTVINDACTRAEFESNRCQDARTGTAIAKTPLLKDPLRGNVYFVRNGNPLPDLFVALRGQVDFDLMGKITIPGSKRLRTTFDLIPDVPIDEFTLKLVSGKDGSVGTAANLCSRRGRTAKAELDFIGQNGKVRQLDQRLKVRGCGHRAGRSRRHGRGGGRGR